MRIVVAPFVLVAASVMGGAFGSARAQAPAADAETPGAKLALLPIVFSSPDTRLALGVLPQYIFHTAPGTRPSNVRADIYYTFNNQFNVQVQPEMWFPGNRWQARAKLQFRKWPTSFHGIGPDAPSEAQAKFTELSFAGSLEGMREFRRGVYAGARFTARAGRIRDVDPVDGPLGRGEVPGAGEIFVAGPGVVATYDTREHVYLPGHGALYRIQADWYGRAFGSDFSFGRMTVDLRQYATIGGPVTAALQAIVSMTAGGDVPFRMLPSVGESVRGFASARYIDRQRWAVNAEMRVIPLWWRLGLAVFGGVGGVTDRLGEFGPPEWSLGVGIRVLMYPSERITVRWDYAQGRASSGDYLDLGEAY